MTVDPLTGFHDARREELYISSKYNLFVLTGQKTSENPHALKNALVLTPFNQLSSDTVQAMRKISQPIENAHKLSVSFNPAKNTLDVYDAFCGKSVELLVTMLDQEVQETLKSRDSMSVFLAKSCAPN